MHNSTLGNFSINPERSFFIIIFTRFLGFFNLFYVLCNAILEIITCKMAENGWIYLFYLY